MIAGAAEGRSYNKFYKSFYKCKLETSTSNVKLLHVQLYKCDLKMFANGIFEIFLV
jgi:hypothetical protein